MPIHTVVVALGIAAAICFALPFLRAIIKAIMDYFLDYDTEMSYNWCYFLYLSFTLFFLCLSICAGVYLLMLTLGALFLVYYDHPQIGPVLQKFKPDLTDKDLADAGRFMGTLGGYVVGAVIGWSLYCLLF